jgi:hypothetical protein
MGEEKIDAGPDAAPPVSPPGSFVGPSGTPDQAILCIEVKGKVWRPKKRKKFKVTAVFGAGKKKAKLKKKKYRKLGWWRKKGWDTVMVSGNIEHGFAIFIQRYPDKGSMT